MHWILAASALFLLQSIMTRGMKQLLNTWLDPGLGAQHDGPYFWGFFIRQLKVHIAEYSDEDNVGSFIAVHPRIGMQDTKLALLHNKQQ